MIHQKYAILRRHSACKKMDTDGKIVFSLKRRHDYYYQIQSQLYCVNRKWCDFVLRTDKEIHREDQKRQGLVGRTDSKATFILLRGSAARTGMH